MSVSIYTCDIYSRQVWTFFSVRLGKENLIEQINFLKKNVKIMEFPLQKLSSLLNIGDLNEQGT